MRKVQLLHLFGPCHAERDACHICEQWSVGLESCFSLSFIITFIASVVLSGSMHGLCEQVLWSNWAQKTETGISLFAYVAGVPFCVSRPIYCCDAYWYYIFVDFTSIYAQRGACLKVIEHIQSESKIKGSILHCIFLQKKTKCTLQCQKHYLAGARCWGIVASTSLLRWGGWIHFRRRQLL